VVRFVTGIPARLARSGGHQAAARGRRYLQALARYPAIYPPLSLLLSSWLIPIFLAMRARPMVLTVAPRRRSVDRLDRCLGPRDPPEHGEQRAVLGRLAVGFRHSTIEPPAGGCRVPVVPLRLRHDVLSPLTPPARTARHAAGFVTARPRAGRCAVAPNTTRRPEFPLDRGDAQPSVERAPDAATCLRKPVQRLLGRGSCCVSAALASARPRRRQAVVRVSRLRLRP